MSSDKYFPDKRSLVNIGKISQIIKDEIQITLQNFQVNYITKQVIVLMVLTT